MRFGPKRGQAHPLCSERDKTSDDRVEPFPAHSPLAERLAEGAIDLDVEMRRNDEPLVRDRCGLLLRWRCRRDPFHDRAPRDGDRGGNGTRDRSDEDHQRGRDIELKRDDRRDRARDRAFNDVA
jgi:hypothetical protein